MKLHPYFLNFSASILIVVSLAGCSSSEDRQNKYMQRAEAMYERGDYKKAGVEVRNVLQINPKNAEARYLFALIHEKTRNWPLVHKNLLIAIQVEPDLVKARIKLGQLYYHGLADDKALEQADAVLTIEPDNADAHTLRGSIFFRQGDNKLAIKEAQLALASVPGHVGAISILTGIYRSEDPERALGVIGDGIDQQTQNATLKLLKASVLEEKGDIKGATEVYKTLIAEFPENLFYYYQIVKFYERHNLIDEAEELLKEIVKTKPEDYQLKLWLAEFLANQRNLTVAETTLLEFIDKQPNVYELRLGLGNVYSAQRQYDDAEAVYQEVAKSDPDGADGQIARNMLVQLYLAQGKEDSAKAMIQNILSIEPENSAALLTNARLMMATNNPTAAVPLLRTIVKNEPNSTEALLLLAQAHETKGRVDLALYHYQEALNSSPGSQAALANVIRLQISQGNFESAELLLNNYRETDPDNPTIAQLRVLLYAKQGNWEKALSTAESLADSQHSPAFGLYLMGRVLFEKADFDGAIKSYNDALEISPENVEISFGLAEAYQASGNLQAAIETCERSLDQSPNNIALMILMAEIYERLAAYEKAAEVYETVLSTGSQQYIAANNLANILVDYLQTEENLKRALELTADFESTEIPTFWDTRGWVLYHNKEYNSSIELLQRAVASSNPPGIFNYHLGMTYFRLGLTDSAKEELQRALASGEEFSGVEEARKILAGL